MRLLEIIVYTVVILIVGAILNVSFNEAKAIEKEVLKGYMRKVPHNAHFYTNKGLECVWVEDLNRAGVSCNWEKYNKDLRSASNGS